MSTYQILPVSDFRNEGWTLTGVSDLVGAWGTLGNDAHYASNPANKGRAAVGFPQDISAANIPDGVSIESVTVYVRANVTDSVSRGLTMNLVTADDTAYFFGRTIPLSTTITTYTVGTFVQDAQSRAWTKDTLNQLVAQVFTYDSGGATDKVRVYGLYVVVNYTGAPGVQITAPTGTVSSSSPAVSWSYSQGDGDIQASAKYKIFTSVQVADTTFNPDYTPSAYPAATTYTIKDGDTLWGLAERYYGNGELYPQIYNASHFRSGDPNLIYPGEIATIPGMGTISGDRTSFTLPFSLAQGDYFIFLQVTSTKGVTSAWVSSEFIVSAAGGAPGAPGGSLGGVGTGGGGGFESVIADPQTSNVFLTLQDGSNLLGVQQADFESLSDPLGWVGTNCTPAQSFASAFGIGGASLGMTATASGDMSVTSTYIAVAAASPLTFRVQMQAATTGRTVNATVAFFDDNFVAQGTPSTGTITDVTGTFTELVMTNFSVPNGATLAQCTVTVKSAAASEVHYLDHAGLMYGTNSAWSNGGHASRNLLTAAQSCADDPIGSYEPYTANMGTTYARVATTGTGADGSKMFQFTYAGVASSVGYVATGTVYSDTSSAAAYTLNKPAGVANGNVLVAYVFAESTGTTGVCTQALAPAGWTVLTTSSNGYVSLSVLLRDGLAADPSTWTGSLSQGATQVRKSAVVVAYSGAAPVAQQFANFNTANTTNGSRTITSAAVSNSDSNAWRLSAFAVNGTGSGGSLTANQSAPVTVIPPIAHVGDATAGSGNGGTSYTIHRPPNLASGHLMVAAVQCTSNVTVNAPTGWIKVNAANGDSSLAVLVRTATGSEPTSWTGSFTSGAGAWATQCTAYANCDVAANQFVASGAQELQTATFYTPVVTNTNSKAWRVSIFGCSSNGGSLLSSNEYVQRGGYAGNSFPATTLGIWDSGEPIGTGANQWFATASPDTNINSSTAFLGFLKPATSTGSPGANDTSRAGVVTGSAAPFLDFGVFDSNGGAATGSTTMYGTYTSGGTPAGAASFLGFLVPGTSSVQGEGGVTLTDYVDLRSISPDVWFRTGNLLTMQAAFLGSAVGTSHLKLYAYRGNELLAEQFAAGSAYNTGEWSKSIAQMVLPEGTTRIKLGMSAVGMSPGDTVSFCRVSAALGGDTIYRQGTNGAAHPMYDVPTVEFAEDLGQGYGDWTSLSDYVGAPLSYDNDTGLCTFQDQTMTPLSTRKYRATTTSYGLAGDTFISDYGPDSEEVVLVAENWWLKDLVSGTSLPLKVYAYALGGGLSGTSVFEVTKTDTSTSFQPLGRKYPIIVTEGYKAESFGISIQVDSNDFTTLMGILESMHTLYLQSNFDKSWWVRPFGNILHDLQALSNMTTSPFRFVQVTFVEVGPGG